MIISLFLLLERTVSERDPFETNVNSPASTAPHPHRSTVHSLTSTTTTTSSRQHPHFLTLRSVRSDRSGPKPLIRSRGSRWPVAATVAQNVPRPAPTNPHLGHLTDPSVLLSIRLQNHIISEVPNVTLQIQVHLTRLGLAVCRENCKK